MPTAGDLDTAIKLLRAAEKQELDIYLKGCINYIIKMKPSKLEMSDAES